MRIVAVIPAYNEAARVASVVEQARAWVTEVLVVDDGSADATAEKAAAAGASVVRHWRNIGKGAALRTGFAWALERGCEAVVALDGDGQHRPEDIPRFLGCFRATLAPIVVGSRRWNRRVMPGHRRLNNGLVSGVGTWLCGQSVPDIQCGYRFLHAVALRAVETETDGFEMEAEYVVRAARMGFRIASVPIETVYAGEQSHVRPWREIERFSRLLFRSLNTPPARSHPALVGGPAGTGRS